MLGIATEPRVWNRGRGSSWRRPHTIQMRSALKSGPHSFFCTLNGTKRFVSCLITLLVCLTSPLTGCWMALKQWLNTEKSDLSFREIRHESTESRDGFVNVCVCGYVWHLFYPSHDICSVIWKSSVYVCVCVNERVRFISFHEFLCGHHPAICHGIWGANRHGNNFHICVCDCEYTLFLTGLSALSIWSRGSDATSFKRCVPATYQTNLLATLYYSRPIKER